MKSKLIILAIACLSATLSSFTTNPTQTTVTGVYDGLEDTNYAFTITTKKGKEKMIFNYLAEDVFENFDLDSDENVGKVFKITYEASVEIIETDEDEDEELEYLTITKLELLAD
ncbi:hypothetical protein [Olleya aquimaris]|uniref:DUF3221 domain-containing protein n=1 Tax=Olleya aquimaris TaxID=639310 RepID=A0A327RF08_9FLAO|nr:hypothetical protein [Olleya aquimaris]RAJ14512.1 hypothetical protein LY08_01687 [Olleya aquimaris]